MLSGWKTGMPCSRAMFFMPLPVWRVLPRSCPAARSGWVTRPTTRPGRPSRASKVGSANTPVPSITTPIPMSLDTSEQFFQLGQLFLDLGIGRQLAALLGLAILALELGDG